MTTPASKSTFAASNPHQAAFIVYINGLEVPAKAASLRYGVWQMPEMQVEMVADPVLVRLGSEDRVQVAVFYYDDCDVGASVKPAFRLFGEGEITGWGYRNTSSGRSIVFTVVNQIAVFTQLFVQFMTTLDDMIAHQTHPGDVSGYANASSQLVYPFALFNQGLLPGQGNASPTRITRPFDFLYNAVRGMMAKNIPDQSRTVPAANFFTRWARLTNFHNRFVGCPFFDEANDKNVFPVLKALQNVSAIDIVIQKLIPQFQNASSIWDMLQLVYTTMLMEVAMIPGMPLITVDLASSMVRTTNFNEHTLSFDPARVGHEVWVPTLPADSRKTKPKRIQNYFTKPQMLFSIPPSCNVVFPSQLTSIAYDEAYMSQPTRLYFNDEVVTSTVKVPTTGLGQAINNALSIAWPLEADALMKARDTSHPLFNGKNFLLYPEEFYKGPVMDRRTIPPWLFFLKQSENQVAGGTGTGSTPQQAADNASAQAQTPAPARTGTTTPPKPAVTLPPGTIVTQSENGQINDNGVRVYLPAIEALRDKVETMSKGSNVPSEYLLCWMNIEAGFGRHSTDSDHATGWFQLLPEECVSLRSVNFPHGVNPRHLVDQPDTDTADTTAIQVGIDYIINGWNEVNGNPALAATKNWPIADRWRFVKLRKHDLPGFALQAMAAATAVLGGPPTDWNALYQAIQGAYPVGTVQRKALDNASAIGILEGASGTIVSQSDKVPFTAGAARAAAPGPSNVTTSKTAAPTPPATPQIDAATQAVIDANALDVYHLYAKFEFFRERYAKRNGSATITWNPYVVPGFPGVLFDQRASRVDLFVYITTVQQQMSNDGRRSTSLSFLYGRQFQELFQTLSDEFALDDSVARGSAPEEPVRDISKVAQSFIQAETYYQQLFYGAQPLFGKAASFDFRAIVGMESLVPGASPDLIFVDGPDVATQDANVAAAQTLSTLTTERDKVSATLLDVASQIAVSKKILAEKQPSAATDVVDAFAAVEQAAINQTQTDLLNLTVQQGLLQVQLSSLNIRINAALSIVQGTENRSGFTRVEHNLDIAATRPLVPLPSSQAYFDSRDAALRYNWRPICTLDEYVVFLNSAAEGSIPAFGHQRSVGARFFERIQTYTPPAADFKPPPASDGLTGTSVTGLSPENFPQTRARWDDALIAYRNNVLYNKAPRT